MRAARRTRTLSALAALALLAALTACGEETDGADDKAGDPGETSSPTDGGPEPRGLAARELAGAEAELALLSQANMGPLFERDEPEVAPDDGQSACASDVAFDDRLDRERVAAADVKADYVMYDDVRILGVSSHVVSFAEESEAEEAFARLAEEMGPCTHIEATEDDGTISVDFEIDDDTATGDVDEQFNMVGSGTMTWGDATFPVAASFSLARLGNNATMVFLVSLGSAEDRELIGPYTEISVARLVAVDEGDTPPDDTAPGPSAPGDRLPKDLSRSLQDDGALAPEALLDLAAID